MSILIFVIYIFLASCDNSQQERLLENIPKNNSSQKETLLKNLKENHFYKRKSENLNKNNIFKEEIKNLKENHFTEKKINEQSNFENKISNINQDKTTEEKSNDLIKSRDLIQINLDTKVQYKITESENLNPQQKVDKKGLKIIDKLILISATLSTILGPYYMYKEYCCPNCSLFYHNLILYSSIINITLGPGNFIVFAYKYFKNKR